VRPVDDDDEGVVVEKSLSSRVGHLGKGIPPPSASAVATVTKMLVTARIPAVSRDR
jgi:hypothetical protein